MHRLRLVAICVFCLVGSAVGAAQQPASSAPQPTARATPIRSAVPRILPGTRASAFTTVLGNALNSTNGALASTPIRLRDARYGRVVDSQVTDNAGLFAFSGVDPGVYVVEIVGPDQTILAASQLITVGAGETASAIVKLPFRIPPFAGILGHTAQQAAVIASAAAASGVLATKVTGVDASAR
jgi:hypothetical protein